MGLQWAKHLRGAVKVTINDISEVCVKMIKENCELNDIRVDGASRGPWGPDGEVKGAAVTGVEVTKMDANVIMHLRPFDYMQVCSATENSPCWMKNRTQGFLIPSCCQSFSHLDPYGTAVNYLDAAFRNVRNLGIISVTSTDTGSLYSKSPNVTLRHYGCHIVRTEYYKELAARMVVATVAR